MARPEGGTEIVLIAPDERTMAMHAAREMPTIGNMNVTNSKKIHVGPKFVSVNQTIENKEMIKDLPLPKYLWKLITNTSRAERLACAASVTTMIVVILLVVYYTVYMRTVESDVVDVAPHPWNISREMWLALPPTGNRTTDHYDPLKIVIIGHTVSSECHTFKECAAELRRMQGSFINDLQYDIPYNFLVGNDGRVYEGRGWNIEGAHTFGFNRCALGIGFIGDYREELESHSKHTQKQLDNVMLLFQEGIKRGHLASDFYVVGARDVGNLKESPGSDLYNAIQKWDFFDHKRQFRNRTCDEIYERV